MAHGHRLDAGHVYTGLIYYDPESEPLDQILHLGDVPLSSLDENDLRPDRAAFDELLGAYR